MNKSNFTIVINTTGHYQLIMHHNELTVLMYHDKSFATLSN